MARPRRGFTMMEMMAVLAVMSILALMAIPNYLDRIVRQQIETALTLADIAKKPIGESWALLQTFPVDNAAAGLPAADKIVSNHVSALAIQDGAIQITFGNRANGTILGKVVSLRPAVVEDAPIVPVAWVCGNAEAPEKMKVRGNNLTNVPDMFLPSACRPMRKAK